MKPLFAPWFFRSVMAQDGGPIERVSYCTLVSSFDTKTFECYAYLKPELAPENSLVLYGTCHGSGTNVSQQIAIYKAFSEAMERWAFFHCLRAGPNVMSKFGFDEEPSTTGMAAFPGLFARSAREYGYAEAVERWAIACWWNGLLSCTRLTTDLPFHAITVQTPSNLKMRVVIVWKQNLQTGLYSYGFAATKSLESAIQKASIEFDRNQRVLAHVFSNNEKIEPSSMLERRLLWFASQEGYEYFAAHVSQTERTQLIAPQPKLIVDGEIRGPWSKYAKVWRCLFERTVTHDDFTSEHIFSF